MHSNALSDKCMEQSISESEHDFPNAVKSHRIIIPCFDFKFISCRIILL